MLVPNKGKLHPPYYQLHYFFSSPNTHIVTDSELHRTMIVLLLAPILSNIPPTNFQAKARPLQICMNLTQIFVVDEVDGQCTKKQYTIYIMKSTLLLCFTQHNVEIQKGSSFLEQVTDSQVATNHARIGPLLSTPTFQIILYDSKT